MIDHQDLRLGPPHYDLASLLNDSLALSAGERRGHLAILGEDGEELALYHAAVAQRMLKIAGTFAHFATLGNDRHLPLIRPALRRFFQALDALPEGRELAPRLRRQWAARMPVERDVQQETPCPPSASKSFSSSSSS